MKCQLNAECEKQGTWNYPIESRLLSLKISLEQSSSSPSWLRSQRSDWTNLSWREELELNFCVSFLLEAFKTYVLG